MSRERLDMREALLDSVVPSARRYLASESDPFCRSLARQLESRGTLSPRQVSALERAATRWEEREERRARRYDGAPEMLEGRRAIRGEVLSTRVVDGNYGPVERMLVQTPEGLLWGTVPRALLDGRDLVGRKVEFVATVRRTEDPRFGVWQRPVVER